MKKLILIRGVPGSGKSTYAQHLAAIFAYQNQVFHFEADQYFIRPDGVYDWSARLLPNAHSWCLKNVEGVMIATSDNVVITVANTFSRKWEMAAYKELANKYGFEIEETVCTGKYQNTHGVPQEKVEQMRDRFEY